MQASASRTSRCKPSTPSKLATPTSTEQLGNVARASAFRRGACVRLQISSSYDSTWARHSARIVRKTHCQCALTRLEVTQGCCRVAVCTIILCPVRPCALLVTKSSAGSVSQMLGRREGHVCALVPLCSLAPFLKWQTQKTNSKSMEKRCCACHEPLFHFSFFSGE